MLRAAVGLRHRHTLNRLTNPRSAITTHWHMCSLCLLSCMFFVGPRSITDRLIACFRWQFYVFVNTADDDQTEECLEINLTVLNMRAVMSGQGQRSGHQ